MPIFSFAFASLSPLVLPFPFPAFPFPDLPLPFCREAGRGESNRTALPTPAWSRCGQLVWYRSCTPFGIFWFALAPGCQLHSPAHLTVVACVSVLAWTILAKGMGYGFP